MLIESIPLASMPPYPGGRVVDAFYYGNRRFAVIEFGIDYEPEFEPKYVYYLVALDFVGIGGRIVEDDYQLGSEISIRSIEQGRQTAVAVFTCY
jgi:hypothetical protein